MQNSAGSKTEHLASTVVDTVKEGTERTRRLASAAAVKTRELKARLGEGMKRAAVRVREKSPHEKVREATAKLADTLESTGTYLERKEFQNMFDEAVAFIRRYPTQTLLIGIGLGFLLALRSRR